jgi:hypothetical protein
MHLAVKLDEDPSPLCVPPIVAAGYAARTVHEQKSTGLSDPDLWTRVQASGELLITADKGFGDIRLYVPGTHKGILLLRPDRDSVPEYRLLIEQTLARTKLDDLVGALAVASPRGLRVRRAAKV